MRLRSLCAATVAAALTMPALLASAQPPLRVQFTRGTVSVEAHGVPLADVLDEWARVGGVAIANAERVPVGRTVTLTLVDVTEDQLLDALLGGVSGAGYLVTRRQDNASHASVYDRMWLVPRLATDATRSATGAPADLGSTSQRSLPR
jgi:hypothetical protein